MACGTSVRLLGDYHSLILLQEDAPMQFCPAMSSKLIANFIRFKKGKPGDALLDGSGVPVLDRMGNPVLCQGGWNDPENVRQMLSAVGALHASRDQRGQYHDRCEACWSQYSTLRESLKSYFTGCFHHTGNPTLWRRGDPMQSVDVENAKRFSDRESQSYQAHANLALLVDELLAIRERAVLSGSLKIWVMSLISVHLFLRSDEWWI